MGSFHHPSTVENKRQGLRSPVQKTGRNETLRIEAATGFLHRPGETLDFQVATCRIAETETPRTGRGALVGHRVSSFVSQANDNSPNSNTGR